MNLANLAAKQVRKSHAPPTRNDNAHAQAKIGCACAGQNGVHLRKTKCYAPAQTKMICTFVDENQVCLRRTQWDAHAQSYFWARMRISFLSMYMSISYFCACASYFCKRMRIFFLCAHANLISLVCAYAFYLFMRSHILYLYTYSRFIVVCPRVFHFCSYASFRVSFCSHRKPFFECCIFLKFEKQYSSEGVLEVVEKLLLYYYF